MATVRSINSDPHNSGCTVVSKFDLSDPSDLAKMSRVLEILAGVQPKQMPVITSAKGVKIVEEGVSVPTNFLAGIANKVGLPGLVKEPSFVALCARFLQDGTLTSTKGGRRSDQAARRIIEWTTQSDALQDLTQKLAGPDGSPDEFKELAEILLAHLKPEGESVVIESSNEDEITWQVRELASGVARTLYINSRLAESPALIQFCEAFIHRGITQPSKIREAWDPMIHKATEGVDGITQLLVDEFNLSIEDKDVLALANALQGRREFLDLAYILAGELDQELIEGGVPFKEAHFKGVSAYYALMGKFWRESKIRTLEEAQAEILSILTRAISREGFEDILVDEYGLMRSGQQGTSLRDLAYALRTLKTVRLVASATQKEE